MLGVSIDDIRKIMKDELELESVINKCMEEIALQESELKARRAACKIIMNNDIPYEELNESIFNDNEAVWTKRLRKVLRDDVDRVFLLKGALSLIFFAYLPILEPIALMDFNMPNGPMTTEDKMFIIAGTVVIVYGLILGIIEGKKRLGLLWTATISQGASWRTSIVNSYIASGIGIAIIAIARANFWSRLGIITSLSILMIVILTAIRAYYMWKNGRPIY